MSNLIINPVTLSVHDARARIEHELVLAAILKSVGLPRHLIEDQHQKRIEHTTLGRVLIGGDRRPDVTAMSSRERNKYCGCGARGDHGRRLKFKKCCGKGK